MSLQKFTKTNSLFMLFFITSITQADSDYLIVSEETENKNVLPAEIIFSTEKHNRVKIDYESNKTAFEQFLDAVNEDPTFGYAGIHTPYRYMDLISGRADKCLSSDRYHYSALVTIHYPHRMEIPSAYSYDLHKKLTKSDLLVAQAYAQISAAGELNAIIPTQEHGFWKCAKNYGCWKMNKKELLEAFEESMTKKDSVKTND